MVFPELVVTFHLLPPAMQWPAVRTVLGPTRVPAQDPTVFPVTSSMSTETDDAWVVATVAGFANLKRGTISSNIAIASGGQVLVDAAGMIRCVGCDCSAAEGASAATRVVCPDGVVSPGLINAHDHLTFAQNAPYTRTAERYEHRRSTCITTNRPFKDWPKVFPDPLNAQVIAERLTEASEVFVFDGKSYRDPRNRPAERT